VLAWVRQIDREAGDRRQDGEKYRKRRGGSGGFDHPRRFAAFDFMLRSAAQVPAFLFLAGAETVLAMRKTAEAVRGMKRDQVFKGVAHGDSHRLPASPGAVARTPRDDSMPSTGRDAE
jgi:hypothetical protein